MKRTNCRACYSKHLHPILNLGSTPLADAFVSDPTAIETWYPLELAVCPECWWVQTTEDVDDSILFGSDYAFFSHSSPSMVEHWKQFADQVAADFPQYHGGRVLEIASNDGTLLKFFKKHDYQIQGVDPAGPPVEVARASSIPTLQESFSSHLAANLPKADIVVANNVFAHVTDPIDFLNGIKKVMKPDGMAVLEFQYFPNLLFNNEFDNIYHEHRSFISLFPLNLLCDELDLEVFDAKEVDTQGGSLRVFIRRMSKGDQSVKVSTLLANELALGINRIETYHGFSARVNWARMKLVEAIRKVRKEGKTIAGYGASAKSCTLLNSCGITAALIDYVEDVTPYKIGKFTPGSHIPVVAPGDRKRPDVYLLLVWNYLDGILSRERVFREGGGKFLVPIPTPKLI